MIYIDETKKVDPSYTRIISHPDTKPTTVVKPSSFSTTSSGSPPSKNIPVMNNNTNNNNIKSVVSRSGSTSPTNMEPSSPASKNKVG